MPSLLPPENYFEDLPANRFDELSANHFDELSGNRLKKLETKTNLETETIRERE